MAGFTTTPDGGWSFSFADPEPKPELPEQPTRATNYLEGPGKWDNYSDDILAEVEGLFRAFMESKKDEHHWKMQNPKYRRYTSGMMYEVLYGKKYDRNDSHAQNAVRRLSKVMSYYSTKKQKEGYILGKRHKNTVYTLSLRRYKTKMPYSLRLRIPWLEEHGKMPVWQNMQLPKDDLEVGHARNRKTDENMRRRRERGRKEYSERYKHRPH